MSVNDMDTVTKRPDELMEKAKRQAADQPDTEVCICLNEKENFKVTYDSIKATFLCSRSIRTQQKPANQ